MRLALVPAAAVAGLLAARADLPKPETFDDAGFTPIFDGKTLTGWSVSAKTGHSATSKHTSGGKWEVKDGAIVGSQDAPGNGGIAITDRGYGDFEVALQMNNDFGPDSGLFLRTDDRGRCYQAMIDYHAGGNLMGLYGEGIGGQPHVQNFSFGDKVTDIRVNPDAPFQCPVSPADWPKFWKHGEWNELRARIEGNPPRVRTWINGVKFLDYTDTQRRLPDAGRIALQVHGGGDYTDQFVRYRNIRVKELKK
jgi:hypothetical protein